MFNKYDTKLRKAFRQKKNIRAGLSTANEDEQQQIFIDLRDTETKYKGEMHKQIVHQAIPKAFLEYMRDIQRQIDSFIYSVSKVHGDNFTTVLNTRINKSVSLFGLPELTENAVYSNLPKTFRYFSTNLSTTLYIGECIHINDLLIEVVKDMKTIRTICSGFMSKLDMYSIAQNQEQYLQNHLNKIPRYVEIKDRYAGLAILEI